MTSPPHRKTRIWPDLDDRWLERAGQLEAFVRENGRMPYQSDAPVGQWLNSQRLAARGKSLGRWTPERRAWLDEHVPRWDQTRDLNALWLQRASALAAFVRDNDRMPYQSDGPLGQWLNTQRRASRGMGEGTWSPDRQAWLDMQVPGWAETPDHDAIWSQHAKEVADYARNSGRLPTQSDGPLGRWLDNQRRAFQESRSVMTPGRRAWLDENVPGWRASFRDRAWQERAEALFDFVRENGRMPYKRDGALGQWLSAQRQAAAGTGRYRWTAERGAWLDEHVPGWADPIEALWNATAEKLVAYFTESGHLPTGGAGELGRWLKAQRQASRATSRARWNPAREAFLDEHVPGWRGASTVRHGEDGA